MTIKIPEINLFNLNEEKTRVFSAGICNDGTLQNSAEFFIMNQNGGFFKWQVTQCLTGEIDAPYLKSDFEKSEKLDSGTLEDLLNLSRRINVWQSDNGQAWEVFFELNNAAGA